ncbi:MAG: hypothetical protein KY467_12045 [Gemmatimonadetes bacterium]|nr:hypothetical protein [Gemmatimonadota bacterium]
MIKRIFSIAALSMMMAACGGDDEVEGEAVDGVEATNTTTEVITEKDTTMAPVVTPVVTQDTGLVETTTTVTSDVDTVVRP